MTTCRKGPQGFHLYDTSQANHPYVRCVECGEPKREVEILAELVQHEPPPGSIVVTKGPGGTAWQRHHTGSWKSTTGRSAVWSAVLEQSRPGSRVWLVHVPPLDISRRPA